MSYAGSRHGSRDNLDEDDPSQPQPRPRQAPVPQSRGAPPSYGQYAEISRAPVDRYAEKQPARSHSPRRYEERPQDQYFPSRSHSPSSNVGYSDAPGRYDERQAPRQRSYSPARTLDVGGHAPHSAYAPSQSGYAPSQSGYAPSQSGYAPSQSGYAASQGGYAQPQGGYYSGPNQGGYAASQGGYPSQGYAPQRPRGQQSGYQPMYQSVGRGGAPSQSSQQYPSRNYYGYQQTGRSGYATRHTKPKHKTVTKDGGYYNVYTDAVVKTKKLKLKGVPTTFLAVTRPWSKNHSNQPRDFMPLVIASIFFNPLLGLIALILSCFTKKAVTEEDWAMAGTFGRITFWLAIAAILSGIIFFAMLIGFLHNEYVPPALH